MIQEVTGYQAEILNIEEVKLPELQRDLARLQSSDGFLDEVDSLILESLIDYFKTTSDSPLDKVSGRRKAS